MNATVSVIFYTIFCARVLFSYIRQLLVQGISLLVKDEKGRALLIRDLNTSSLRISPARPGWIFPWDHFYHG